MINPHGGKLINRILRREERDKVLEKVKEMPSLKLNQESVSEVENIAFGVFSPLEGFLGKREYQNVLNQMRLPNDLPWPIPVVLDVGREKADKFKEGQDIILLNEDKQPVAVLHLEEKYEYSKEEKKDISSWQDLFLSLTGIDLRICPKCKKGRLIHKRGLVKKNIILLRFG